MSADPLAKTEPSAETWPATLRALAKDCRETREAVARIEARVTRTHFEFNLVAYMALLMAAASMAVSCLR